LLFTLFFHTLIVLLLAMHDLTCLLPLKVGIVFCVWVLETMINVLRMTLLHGI